MSNDELKFFKKCICGNPATIAFKSVMTVEVSKRFEDNYYCGNLKCFLRMNWVPKIIEKLNSLKD